MSELLLKGATMTNQHCNRCGDPIFRFDGQAFCPSCQEAEVAGGQIRIRNPNATPTPEEADADAIEEAPTQSATGETAAAADADATDESESAEPAASTPNQQTVEPTQPPVPATESDDQQATDTSSTSSTTAASRSVGEAADLDAARAALRRTVTKYAEEAERTDDPRRARELLAAAHEAAETLAALRR